MQSTTHQKWAGHCTSNRSFVAFAALSCCCLCIHETHQKQSLSIADREQGYLAFCQHATNQSKLGVVMHRSKWQSCKPVQTELIVQWAAYPDQTYQPRQDTRSALHTVFLCHTFYLCRESDRCEGRMVSYTLRSVERICRSICLLGHV